LGYVTNQKAHRRVIFILKISNTHPFILTSADKFLIGMIYQEISNSIFLTIFAVVLLLGLLFILLRDLWFRLKKDKK